MLKPDNLRDALTRALPELARDPERLVMLITDGKIINSGTRALSWEYRYTLSVIVLDWAGHADAIVAPLLLWLRHHQPEVLDNPDLREKALRFKVDFLTTATVDLQFELQLSEAVLARPREGVPGGLNLIHKDEPLPPYVILKAEHWEMYVRDQKVAEWDHDPT